ncbi:probable serine/threonine-protein kinase yakA isoform X1 [Aedes aegypti]|uniref:Centrosome-associated FAM110 C-terminal domain-containing protein n=1 Tax=Aedes aegypti TaxID=7159 RepID=A0A6I8TI24_AEDAE|nr:probable serine/threonine-protein kinase yakA isoform X1 [Aedes aegypti]XP_021696821.1 probable serine/threonine-protein kinase yakA isoform X1 [Aedes aegypti]XP_021696823.1 probable serine/threonine-protein kinase yakA isoform X1 [Aedes aegypti]XP_021696824.1 probable serine/threonine-protein kinase yakA isoform X1 [Aedes aegypti]XP_021696825.1 probable serine/threonine-protein kinase yakA isoform X1 [Aedes aegypti]XP_021696826.1 probable serine/threonine-protein kinase yakA isoform X1 [Ae
MAAVVYGNSPRHSSRHHHSGSGQSHLGGVTPHSPYHQHQQQQQQHHSLPSHHHVAASSITALSQQIITPPTSYLSTSTTTISSTSHQQTTYYLHQQQQQQQHQQAVHYHNMRNSKRKSAVELLAESKPFYVKSEMVLDRQQQLNMRGGSSGPVSGSYMLSPSRTLPQSSSQMQVSSHHPQSQQQQRPASRRSASSGSDLLQTKLRKLLNTADSKETIIPSDMALNSKYGPPTLETTYISGAGMPGNDCIGYIQPPKNYQQQLTVHPEQPSDVSVFFPSAFLSPQSLPPHAVGDDDLYLYSVHDSLVLTDDYRAISPPAEYAENNASPEKHNSSHRPYRSSRYNYQRSYSHSQAVAHQDESDYSPTQSYNINSHKSLPDLHSQISRHSPHSEALSCCSRGNRSNRSGSSFNRDSGGSSGHYTHHSEPCCKQQQQQQQQQQKDALIMGGGADYRRDSGSSTQHSGNSYYAYGIPPLRYDCIECRAKIREEADCLLNFTTPEVPEAFQDNYSEKQKQKYYDEPRDRGAAARKYYKNPGPMSPLSPVSPLSPQDQQLDLSPPLGTFKRQKCLRFKNRGRQSAISNPNSRCGDGRGSSGGDEDRRPILRSKSDISDRYWNRLTERNDRERDRDREREQQKLLEKQRSRSDSLTQLEHFFDRLGLHDETYERYIAPKVPKSPNYKSSSGSDIHRLSPEDTGDSDESSAVFFSDVSTIDSTRLPDSTETTNEQPKSAPGQLTVAAAPLNSLNNPALYRPSEPPSIIERNARIIKWLCNCKKMQLA